MSGENRWRDFQVPADTGAPFSLGAMLVFVGAVQGATGVLLLVHFVADPAGAFESVRSLMRDVPYGWLVRLVHVHGANWMVAIAFVHLIHTAFRGAYKEREAVWMSGCVLFLLVMTAALSGSLLPWSQASYWAATVVTASLSYVPFVGQDLLEIFRGGDRVSDATFRRAFAAHVGLLPLLLLGFVALHLAWVRRLGLAGRPTGPGSQTVSFLPRIGMRYALSCLGFSLLLMAGVTFAPSIFFSPEHGLPADPFETPASVKPAWYFLWAYELPRLMPERLSMLLQGGAVVGLFALPWLDRGSERHPSARRLWVGMLAVAVVALVVLSVLGHLA